MKFELVCNINCVWFSICVDAKNPATEKHEQNTNCEGYIRKEDED
jgi:hypothetical protein